MLTDGLPLIDHHCHGVLERDLADDELERWLSESYLPPAPGCSYWDSPLGLAVRRWCAPVLDLEGLAAPEVYAERRRELGHEVVNQRLLAGAKVDGVLVDTGLPEPLSSPRRLGELAGAPGGEIIRLEPLAEEVIAAGVEPGEYADAVGRALERRLPGAVALKTVIAYRGGLAFDPTRPRAGEVSVAASRLTSAAGASLQLDDPVLLRHLLWLGIDAAARRRLPLQIHTGFGDPDVLLDRTDPSLLTPLLRLLQPTDVVVMLLHCYPYHRQAGYLAAMFPNVYVDVGLAINHLGPSATHVLGELMEITPFHKHLYSSDAIALAELHFLGALLFRRSLSEVLDRWIAAEHLDADTALTIAAQLASGNSERLYRLSRRDDRALVDAATSPR